MSDLMFYGVLRMPYKLAMSDEISRLQFWNRAQEAARRVEDAEAKLAACATPAPQAAPSELLEQRRRMFRAYSECLTCAKPPQDIADYLIAAAAPAVAITQAAPAGTIEIDGATFTAAEIKTRITELDAEAKAYHEQLEAAGARIEELEAITQAATSEDMLPLTMAVYGTRTALELERQRRADVAARMAAYPAQAATSEPVARVDEGDDGMFAEILPNVSVKVGQHLYAAPVAHLAGTTPNTEAASVTLPAELTPDSLTECAVQKSSKEHHCDGWNACLRSVRAALSAQQAGVQEAPGEDAKDAAAFAVVSVKGGIHKLAVTRDSAERKAAAWKKEWPDNGCTVRPLVFGDLSGTAKGKASTNQPVIKEWYERHPLARESEPIAAGCMLNEIDELRAALAAATQTEKP